MKKSIAVYVLMSFCAAGHVAAQQTETRTGEIKYISQSTFYIDLGADQGLTVGGAVTVRRGNRTIARLVVQHVARLSAACKLVSGRADVKQGDRVEVIVPIQRGASSGLSSETAAPAKAETPDSARAPQKRPVALKRRRENNRIRGRFGLQSLWFEDRTNSSLNYNQLALRSTLKVQRFLGLPLELRLRWRTRAHHRERALSSTISEDEWTHHVHELALVYEDENAPYEFGFGRVLSNRVRGLGYIDGGLFSAKLPGPWRVGVAGGTEPSLRGSGFQTDEQKFGVFLNFEQGDYQSRRVSSTVAFSGRYHGGTTSREFVYLQNNFSMGSTLSLYQTVEMDLNRGWKLENGEAAVQFSNVYLSGHYRPNEFVSVNLSFDARKNIRVYETRSIPDSLFDETMRQGLHAGLTLRLPQHVRLSGSFGLRFRQGDLSNTMSASGTLTIPQILNTWATFNARLSYFSTMFTKGYRPNFDLRIPLLRDLSVNLSGGSYIYRSGNLSSSSYWLETEGYYRISRMLYANMGYRMFFDERLNSGRLFLESGIVF